MPISYTIDSAIRVIFETWNGEVTAADLESYWKRYLDDPEVMKIRTTLVDLRAAEILFRSVELDHLVKTLVLPKLAGRKWKSALLVGGPVQFGVSRQYQVFADFYSYDSIFHDRDRALEWLVQPPENEAPR